MPVLNQFQRANCFFFPFFPAENASNTPLPSAGDWDAYVPLDPLF